MSVGRSTAGIPFTDSERKIHYIFVIGVPLALASLVTGIISSLGTTWGLFRYYWVLVKLGLTSLATLALLVHTRPISSAAR